METSKALETIFKLIEQCNAAGAFKKLADLDLVREAYKIIKEELEKAS